MTDTTLTFPSGDIALAGTLTTPPGTGPFPAALLIPGSGPVDRDSNHKRMPLDITRQLAHALRDAGVATLRYDKRGVGASGGRWRAAGFGDNADDARAALAGLASRPEVDRSRIVIAGHSEGALLATIVAAGNDELAGVILLSGSATPGEELLRWQVRQIAPTLPTAVRILLRLLRTDLEQKVAKNHVKLKATTTDEAWVDGAKLNARWHREFMAYDPRADLARISAPVLALTGSKDLQAKPADLEVIAELVPAPVEARLVPDVNHILRPQPGPATLRTYRTDLHGPVDPRVTAQIVGWLAELFARLAGDGSRPAPGNAPAPSTRA
ncbi:alpha/beta hydrolase family protein [Puerhibacterium sp. TATVAM-FAB25]|uniref:alpha/beta hydrolase family protein n=1 Tax=Puerhibacterium sp. TATVAM-FAB25 TaxID=3093699 RepID=UPI003977EFD5